MATKPQAAIDRIRAANGNAYNAQTNPGGLALGGHRPNFAPNVNAVVDVGLWAEALATEAAANAAQTAEDETNTAADRAASAQILTQTTSVKTDAVNLTTAQANRAQTEANRAQGYANGLNLPALTSADAGEFLQVNGAGSGYVAVPLPIGGIQADIATIQSQARYLSLITAAAYGNSFRIKDGIVDTLADPSDLAVVTNAGFIEALGLGPNAPSSGVNLRTVGSAISNGGTAAANAFDGSTSTSWTSAENGTGVTNVSWIGRDFGAGNSQAIVSATVSQPNRIQTNSGIASFNLECSDDGSSWSVIGTGIFPNDGANVQTATVTVPRAQLRKARYWRILATSGTSGTNWIVHELQLFAAAIQNSTLISTPFASAIGAPSNARIIAQVSNGPLTGAPAVGSDLLFDVSRNGGGAYTTIPLSLSQQMGDNLLLYEGTASLTSTSGSSLVWRMRSFNAIDFRLAGLLLQWGNN